MKNLRSIFSALFISAICFTACEEDDSTQPSTPGTITGGGTNPTDTSGTPVGDQFWLGNGAVKCIPFSKNFTGFINLLSINTDKCYQEFVRPNFTFDFMNTSSSFTFGAGTYNIVADFASQTNDMDVIFSMSGYNSKQYSAVSGTMIVTKSQTDSTKWNLEWDKINLYSETDRANHTFTGRIEDF